MSDYSFCTPLVKFIFPRRENTLKPTIFAQISVFLGRRVWDINNGNPV